MRQSPWQYFTMEELTCRCGCGLMNMDSDFMAKVVSLRRELGFPLAVTSATRCSKHNQNVSNTGPRGPHTTGHAIDILASGERALIILQAALNLNQFSGIGLNQKGAHTARFIHLDDLRPPVHAPRPHIWTY